MGVVRWWWGRVPSGSSGGGGGGGLVLGRGVLHDNNNDDRCMTPLGRFDLQSRASPTDSTVLAYVLKQLNERYGYGLHLMLLSVDEGITGYRDDSLEVTSPLPLPPHADRPPLLLCSDILSTSLPADPLSTPKGPTALLMTIELSAFRGLVSLHLNSWRLGVGLDC